MHDLVEKAFAAISRLPKADQEAIAALILEEISSDERWQGAFDSSTDKLAALANEALAEYRAERTEPLDPEGL